MKIKLYSARELDKKFPSGKWNDFEIIKRYGNKAFWKYYGLSRFMYNKLARCYQQASICDENSLCKVYTILIPGFNVRFPEIFVKKVKQ